MTREDLRHAKPEDIRRLAVFLKLRIDGMSIKQIKSLIVWRLHKNRRWGR